MANQWLPVSESSTASKGGGTTVTTSDTNTRTTTRGPKTTTANRGVSTTTSARGAKVTTRAEAAFTKTSSTTVTEDAGGTVSFSVPIRGGLGVTGVAALCPT